MGRQVGEGMDENVLLEAVRSQRWPLRTMGRRGMITVDELTFTEK